MRVGINMAAGQALAMPLIERFEGRKLVAYLDTANPPKPTIGVGTRFYPDGSEVQLGDTCTDAEADQYLNYHLQNSVFPFLSSYDLPPKIYAACCSLIYECGKPGPSLCNVLMLQKWDYLPDIFLEYVVVSGRVSAALQQRRKAEIAYFTS